MHTKVMLHDLDLNVVERCAVRRQYRHLRLAIYAPQSSEYASNGMLQMVYGMSRNEAKDFIMQYYRELSWHMYLGEK